MPKPSKLTTVAQVEAMKALKQGAAAWLIGQHPRSFRDALAPRNADGSYDARNLVAWAREGTVTDDDPLLGAGDSPNLERYRAAKAQLAEMDAAERRGQLVDIDQLVEWWANEVAGPLRRAAATLQARFGADAEAIVIAALSKADSTIEKRKPAA